MYHYQFPIKKLAQKRENFSERNFCIKSGMSRAGLRNIMIKNENIGLKSIINVASYLNQDIYLMATNHSTNTDFSTISICYKIIQDGLDSWKIHFMEMVDEFRNTLDPQLILLAPPSNFPRHLKAMLAAIIVELCNETNIDAPSWSCKMYFLDRPWFVSGMQSLKAIALAESPLAFRRNNIFVHNNFLQRI